MPLMHEILGMTKEQYQKWYDEDKKNWCQEHDGLESYYHTDGETPLESCVTKHHYHCNQCNLLTQIG